jgi:Ca2+-binding EF-hand superfamily protein
MLKAFQTFDQAKEGMIETFKVATILKAMNVPFDKDELARTIEAYNPESINVIAPLISFSDDDDLYG